MYTVFGYAPFQLTLLMPLQDISVYHIKLDNPLPGCPVRGTQVLLVKLHLDFLASSGSIYAPAQQVLIMGVLRDAGAC